MISKHINKDNLHHAYLLEGDRNQILSELLLLLEKIGIKTSANPDFYNIEIDTFKIEDARNLKSLTSSRSFSNYEESKKVFIISANSFLLEAQNSLLKVFEEPIENTHFFIIAPSSQMFVPTLLSRFYVIKNNSGAETDEAEKFVNMPLAKRIDYIKELLSEADVEEESSNSPRSKALQFLNQIEEVLHKKYDKIRLSPVTKSFEQIFQVRKYLRQPGSSAKSLMESVALSIPEK